MGGAIGREVVENDVKLGVKNEVENQARLTP